MVYLNVVQSPFYEHQFENLLLSCAFLSPKNKGILEIKEYADDVWSGRDGVTSMEVTERIGGC